jgi:hypothetical protein
VHSMKLSKEWTMKKKEKRLLVSFHPSTSFNKQFDWECLLQIKTDQLKEKHSTQSGSYVPCFHYNAFINFQSHLQ